MREPERDLGRLQDVKNVEIIGEAADMLSLEFKEKHAHIPWNDIIRMRHVLVHGYATILPELLWYTALVDVPILKEQIESGRRSGGCSAGCAAPVSPSRASAIFSGCPRPRYG